MSKLSEILNNVLSSIAELSDAELQAEFDVCKNGSVGRAILEGQSSMEGYKQQLKDSKLSEDLNMSTQLDQWDESVRGKKMSSSSGKVIFKYQMPILEEFYMTLPKGAEIIRVDDQDGMFWMWCVVDTNVEDEKRKFYSVKCGANVPDGDLKYLGFCAIFVQQELGLYIFEDIGYVKEAV